MKSIINKEEEKKEDIKYPCLMYFKDAQGETVTLFTSFEKGICLYTTRELDRGQTLHDKWYQKAFTPFKGSITLSND